jgi:hypothetical protein
MALPEATEAVLNAAIEALYALQGEGASQERLEAAGMDWQQDYLRVSSEQWWEKQCQDFPECPQCKQYDC